MDDDASETTFSTTSINGLHSPKPVVQTQNLSDDLRQQRSEYDSLAVELQALRVSYQIIQSKFTEGDENLTLARREKDEILKQNCDLTEAIKEVSTERGFLKDEFHKLKASSQEREDRLICENEEIKEELGICSERIEELLQEKSANIRMCLENMEVVKLVKEGLVRVIESLDEEGVGVLDQADQERSKKLGSIWELGEILVELKGLAEFVNKIELKLEEYKEKRKKEERELESSVVSLTEENRDINSLLRIALVEKEAVEKSLNNLKGNNEQKRGAILQIAERGLQKVGFGFMMGAGANEQSSENSGANLAAKSDSSECEEEVVSLASTVERIMKNLRLEITQLRRSLDESRSETERLQTLTEKQAHKLAEDLFYIKQLEDRELMLTQNVEELQIQIKETEEEVARWREACELEVEAGKNVVEEHERVVSILKQELEKARAALNVANGKLKLKEELVAAAIAAEEAAERSLQLADSRAAGLREQIEELTRNLEETEKRGRDNRHKIRHICWPWRALKFNPNNSTSSGVRNVRRMLPEMQTLLH